MQNDPFHRLPADAVTVLPVGQGAVIFRQGDRATGLFRVIRGSVVLRRATATGAPVVLHRATTGQLFAEASVFSAEYHCDAVCTQDGDVARIDKAAVAQALRADPDFAESFARLLAVQVQQYRQILELMSIQSARDRVLSAVHSGLLSGSVVEFSARIGLTHEACYRALRRLVDEGRLVKTARGRYGPKP